jgi:hypothetical protein
MKYIIKDCNNKNFAFNNEQIYIDSNGQITYDKNKAHLWSDDVARILCREYNIYCHKSNGNFWILIDKLPDDKYIPQPGDIFIQTNDDSVKGFRFVQINIDELEGVDQSDICAGVDQNGETWFFNQRDILVKVGDL